MDTHAESEDNLAFFVFSTYSRMLTIYFVYTTWYMIFYQPVAYDAKVQSASTGVYEEKK
jgi:hypothetical protein